jgi:hypothetical protein
MAWSIIDGIPEIVKGAITTETHKDSVVKASSNLRKKVPEQPGYQVEVNPKDRKTVYKIIGDGQTHLFRSRTTSFSYVETYLATSALVQFNDVELKCVL